MGAVSVSGPALSRRAAVRLGLGLLGLGGAICLGSSLSTLQQAFGLSAADVITSDDDVSIYVGGNWRIDELAETEGVSVVEGSAHYYCTTGGSVLGGHVLWGLNTPPSDDTVVVRIGGNLDSDYGWPLMSEGHARIGGLVNGTASVWRNGTQASRVEGVNGGGIGTNTTQNLSEFQYPMSYYIQESARIQTNIGKAAALGSYQNYWASSISSLVQGLRQRATTGTYEVASWGHIHHCVADADYIDSDFEAALRFIGDGSSAIQVFDVDLASVWSQVSNLGKQQWALVFDEVPDDAFLVCRMHGSNPLVRFGWACQQNGVDMLTSVNTSYAAESFLRFRDLASRIIWVFDDGCGTLHVDNAHGLLSDGSDVYSGSHMGSSGYRLGCGNLLPGSILCPGNAYVEGSTNGKLYVQGDLQIDTWEHHNVVWRGMKTGFVNEQKAPQYASWL